MTSVCVVGAGIAGMACARALTDSGVDVTVLERGRAVGGRMASRTVEGRAVDTGAQYFTVADPGFAAVVASWAERGLAREWTDTLEVYDGGARGSPKSGPVRWGAAGGLRSLVTDLAGGLEVRLQTRVETVGQGAAVARPTVDGDAHDAVVLAMPDPQALRLLAPDLGDERAQVGSREWQPQLALLAGFAERSWDTALRDAAFVNGDDVLSVVADDGARRGDGAAVLVTHSTVPFAAAHLDDPDAALPAMVAALRALLGLPEPVWAQVHRWSFAKPAAPRDTPFWLGPSMVGLCGDGWGSSKVETAWTSGDALGRHLATLLT